MSEIKRYSIKEMGDSLVLSRHRDGTLMFYDDHQAALKQARIDAVLDLKRELSQLGTDVSGECVWVDDMANVIYEFIEQLKEQGE